MHLYGSQLEPVLHVVLNVPPGSWDLESADSEERAVARAEVSRWLSMRT